MAPAMAEIRNSTIATKKMILAMPTAVPAMPPKPSSAAISAIDQEGQRPTQHDSLHALDAPQRIVGNINAAATDLVSLRFADNRRIS